MLQFKDENKASYFYVQADNSTPKMISGAIPCQACIMVSNWE